MEETVLTEAYQLEEKIKHFVFEDHLFKSFTKLLESEKQEDLCHLDCESLEAVKYLTESFGSDIIIKSLDRFLTQAELAAKIEASGACVDF